MLIGGREFSIRPLGKEAYRAWMKFCDRIAREGDQPLARFITQHLDGLNPQDRQAALTAFMSRDDWDAPSREARSGAQKSLSGVRALATYCFDPEVSWEETESLVTEDNKQAIIEAIRKATNPTVDDIKELNQALREHMARKEAGTEGS